MQSEDQKELRQYYRIDDVVTLSYEMLDKNTPGASLEGAESGLEVSAGTLLAEIDRELNTAINTIWQNSPVVAQALGLLNRKVSMVAAQVLEEYEVNDGHTYDDTKVNLSGCGIAFEAREAIAGGARLRLNLILKPTQINVSIAGTVIACEERLSAPVMLYWVRVKFDDDVQAREQLIRHVVERQVTQLSDENAKRR